MNPLITSEFIKIAQWMRFAAIANFISQGIDIATSFNQPFIYWNIATSIIPVVSSIFLLSAAQNQPYYMAVGYEKQFAKGLAREVNYWRLSAIFFVLILVVLALIAIMCFTMWGFVNGLASKTLNS